MSTKITSFSMDLHPGYQVYAALYTNVTNTGQIRDKLIKSSMNCTLLNCALVPGVFPVLLACNKAVRSCKTSSMKTRTLRTEVLFNLSPSNSINGSLKTFRLEDSDRSILFVFITDNESSLKEFKDMLTEVKGEAVITDEIANLCDMSKIKSLYKVTEDELCLGSISDSVSMRVATKDAL